MRTTVSIEFGRTQPFDLQVRGSLHFERRRVADATVTTGATQDHPLPGAAIRRIQPPQQVLTLGAELPRCAFARRHDFSMRHACPSTNRLDHLPLTATLDLLPSDIGSTLTAKVLALASPPITCAPLGRCQAEICTRVERRRTLSGPPFRLYARTRTSTISYVSGSTMQITSFTTMYL